MLLSLQVEIKVYKQKVKHLLYEHQNNITTLKADGELALKLQQVSQGLVYGWLVLGAPGGLSDVGSAVLGIEAGHKGRTGPAAAS